MLQAPHIILLIGGTGTWGQAATRFFLDHTQATIRIFSRGETLQHDMRERFANDPRLRFLIGDVRSQTRLEEAMQGVDLVFHAAALKQVPSGEYNIGEVLRTNILGTENVVRAARQRYVKKVVFLSTDKAVAAINSYGVSKAFSERVIIQANGYDPHGTEYLCVRYGNVWQSRGSVGLLWQTALHEGRPLTVTDLGMTRFFITAQEAVETAWFAAQYAPRGTVIIPHIPAYSMRDLCQAVCEEASMAMCELVHIGVRPGEKYHESLLGIEECARVAMYVNEAGVIYYCVEPAQPSWSMPLMPEWPCASQGQWERCRVSAYHSETWPVRLGVEELRRRLRIL